MKEAENVIFYCKTLLKLQNSFSLKRVFVLHWSPRNKLMISGRRFILNCPKLSINIFDAWLLHAFKLGMRIWLAAVMARGKNIQNQRVWGGVDAGGGYFTGFDCFACLQFWVERNIIKWDQDH